MQSHRVVAQSLDAQVLAHSSFRTVLPWRSTPSLPSLSAECARSCAVVRKFLRTFFCVPGPTSFQQPENKLKTLIYMALSIYGTDLDNSQPPTGRYRLPGTLTLFSKEHIHGYTSVHVRHWRKTRSDHCRRLHRRLGWQHLPGRSRRPGHGSGFQPRRDHPA
ncbi:hypothetical protein EMIT0P294_140081 [Pseudomonas sp. IT-P294]